MKNVTLIISLCFLSLSGYAQLQSTDAKSILNQEREMEYIIVLDDTKVEGNIDILLRGKVLHDEKNDNNGLHELVHNAPNEFTLEGRLVEGAYSYNEYAINYRPEVGVSVAGS